MVSIPTGNAVSTYTKNGVRPSDSRTDLGAIADLIELCFQDSMDPEGHSYLRHLREAARYGWMVGWTSIILENDGYPRLNGYVWIEDGRLVGNLSIFPFTSRGQRCLLIANVAVHPDFRGRGIATQLTRQALDYARQQRISSVWLQVRDNNPPAIHLYLKHNFQERARRTTWVNALKMPQLPCGSIYTLDRRLVGHWPHQKAWLERLYPAEFAWHLPVHWRVLPPGFLGSLSRFLSFNYPRHWTVRQGHTLLGVLTWLQAYGHTDHFLLAAPAEPDVQALQILFAYAQRQLSVRRRLSLNIPAGYADEALQNAGFRAQQTLIWMETCLS